MARHCMTRKGAKWAIGIGTVLLALSLAVLFIFPSLYKKQLKYQIALNDGSLATTIWKDIPLPIYEKIYFFNVTNAFEFLKLDEPLNVTEVGPYTYRSRWVKNDPVWNDNGTVTYRETRTYHFIPEMSVGSQDDIIHTLNGPMIIGASMLKKYNIGLRLIYSLAMKLESETIVTLKTVRELLYEGYEDPIIKYAPLLKPDIPFKNGVFSWLYGKNATDDGSFTVFTGADNASLTNMINNWNGNEALTFWKTKTCNMMNGTNVEFGPPIEGVQESYSFFQSILCRSLTFNYTGDQTHLDVLTKRFEVTPSLFANSSENPDNAGFEVQKERPSGVLDISPCQFDAPVILSFPHFHLADPSYLQVINGLSPNEDLHGSHVDVEPITGISLDVSVKFQMNIEMERVRGVLQFDNVPEGVFPVFWLSLELHMTENWARFLKDQINNPKIIAYSVLGIVSVISVILIVWGLFVLHSSKKADEDPLMIEDGKKPPRNVNSQYNSITNKSFEAGERYSGGETSGNHTPTLQECPPAPSNQ